MYKVRSGLQGGRGQIQGYIGVTEPDDLDCWTSLVRVMLHRLNTTLTNVPDEPWR